MPSRILMDPAPDQGGGGTPAPATPPAPAATAPPAPPPAVTIPFDQFQTMQQQLAAAGQLQAAAAEAQRVAAQAAADAATREGNHKEALRILREQHAGEIAQRDGTHAAFVSTAKTAWRDSQLTLALQGVPDLIPGAAEHLHKLWRDQFEAHPEGQGFAVRTATYQAPADFIKAELARPAYSLFVKAPSRGGAHQGGGNAPPAVPPGQGPAPGSLEAIAASWHQAQGKYPSFGMGPKAPTA